MFDPPEDSPVESPPPARPVWSPGILAMIGMLIGVLMSLIGLLSIVNAGLGLDLAIGVGGADVALPRFMNEAIPVLVIGLGIAGGSAAGSYAIHLLREMKSWPLRIGVGLVALGLVSLGGWYGFQAFQANMYGSMAAAHAANGSVDAMLAELDAGVSEDVQRDCMFRGMQFGEVEVVDALLARGLEPIGQFSDGETTCMLEDADEAIVAVAARRGWSADCQRSEQTAGAE